MSANLILITCEFQNPTRGQEYQNWILSIATDWVNRCQANALTTVLTRSREARIGSGQCSDRSIFECDHVGSLQSLYESCLTLCVAVVHCPSPYYCIDSPLPTILLLSSGARPRNIIATVCSDGVGGARQYS